MKVAQRLDQVDALRGLAALAVVLFHFTFRYDELLPGSGAPLFRFQGGQYGVNLFFEISGFVILMTLQRTRKASDFVVARFSRLYPAYWACVALSFCLAALIGPAVPQVTPLQALGNALMFHGLFNIPSVDGAYWTLEVELIFYVLMLLAFLTRQLRHIHLWLIALMALRCAGVASALLGGPDVPWTLTRLLILPRLPWFTLGLVVFALLQLPDADTAPWPRWQPAAAAAVALVTIAFTESLPMAALGLLFAALLHGAAGGRLGWLGLAPLVWLGSISYPLYLLHENIGWAVMARALAAGIERNLAMLLALALVLLLAQAATRWVEQPCLRWIRARFRGRARGVALPLPGLD